MVLEPQSRLEWLIGMRLFSNNVTDRCPRCTMHFLPEKYDFVAGVTDDAVLVYVNYFFREMFSS